MNAQIKLGAEGRSSVRRAISDNAGWRDYAKRTGRRIDIMSSGELLETCADLGIDVYALLGTKPAESPFPTPSLPATESKAEPMPATATLPAKIESPRVPVIPADDAAAQLANLITSIAGGAKAPVDMSQVRAEIDSRLEGIVSSVAETASAVVASALAKAPVTRIEVKGVDAKVREVKGHKHPSFAKLLRAASARMLNGFAPSIWLAGPAGSGKTHAGHMLAESLGLAFHLNGAISMPHELVGFIDAGGTYHRTPFREAYEHGGVYMFDEVDGSDNAALLALNAALANGHATFPDARVPRHPNCIIIASANTWGLGATAEYVGRAKIDAAFLSRFPVRISWQYDTDTEIAISGNESFARRVIAARKKAANAGLKVLIDPRASQAGAALIAAGFSEKDAAEMTYLANLTAEQRAMID